MFLFATLFITPLFAIPVPDNTNDSGVINPLPTIFIAEPTDTVVMDAHVTPSEVLPNASWFCI